MSYQVLARKWRPRTFHEVAGQEHVLRALINALDNDRLHHAFLFTGTRGVGKTTIARILAKSLNCETGVSANPCGKCSACLEIDEGRFIDLIEVDAASRTKVEDTRELLDNVQYAPSRGRYKVYLIDEVHMLSGHSFNALLKTLEEPPPHVKFLLATTDPQKLPITILSRCLQFNLKHLPRETIAKQLLHILEQEGVSYEESAVTQLARAAEGSMRDALSLMDQAISYGNGQLQAKEVHDMLGSIDDRYIIAIIDALAAGNGQAILENVHALSEQVSDYSAILTGLVSLLHQIALAQVVPESVDETFDNHEDIRRLADALLAEDVQLFYQIGVTGRREITLAPDPRSGLEMTLLRMLAFRPVNPQLANVIPQTTQSRPATPASEPVSASTSTKSVEAPAVTRPETTASIASGQDTNWVNMVANLGLTGVVKELAANCELTSQDDKQVVLTINKEHASLVSKERVKRMQQSLQQYLGKPVKLAIEVGAINAETPAAIKTRQENERHQAAVVSIEEDSNVQALRDVFGADVKPELIEPVD